MKQSARDGRYHLTTGRTFSANDGILGLTPEEPLKLFHGYDGQVQDGHEEWMHPEDTWDEFTPAERQEIAEFMTALWKAWASR